MALGWLWWRAWSGLVGVDAYGGIACNTFVGQAWQVWVMVNLVTFTVLLCGKSGAYGLRLTAAYGGLWWLMA